MPSASILCVIAFSRALTAAAITMMALATSGWGAAQSTTLVGKSAVASGAGQPLVPTLLSLDQSLRTQDFTAIQLRRFRDDQGNVVSVRERLQVDANGSARPGFAVTFLQVEGELPGSATDLKWQQKYAQFASLFYTHGTFRVHELTAAASNYTLHDFGPVVRANRAARRMVVFPATVDKAIWVVDFDSLTGVPLYSVEFDSQLHVLAEVEVLSFTNAVAPLVPALSSTTQHNDYNTAIAFMGGPRQMIDPIVALTSEYQLDRVEVRDDPLNGRQALVMTYTDGVDQFVVVQSPGTPDFFAGLPSMSGGGKSIARYRDPAMSVLLFWDAGVSFHVAGRGSLRRLDDLAQALYLQALSTN